MRTTVHLLRHGEVHNPDRILYGRMPGFRLSDDGLEMAHAAGMALRDRDVVEVVSSPLQRAQETAEPIADVFGLAVTTDDRLIEAANIFEGEKALEDGAWKAPHNWRHLRNPLEPSWGEPYAELAARMLAAVEDVRDRVHGHEAVLVSHQLPIWTVRRLVEGRRLWHRPDQRQCGLASLTSLTWVGGRLDRVTYSEPAGEASRRPGKGA
ncbi:MAG: histidine phosphatase family protein [Frankiaceae bacterium]|nr:histidine phosphatase family protein [Frankiaceae bacterium]